MNNKEVYINGQLIDLDEKENPIELTYAINDLAELKDRQAYASNIFKVPLTANNLSVCGFANNPTLIQTQPYRKNSAKVVQGGIEILPNGIAIITKSNEALEIQVLSGLIGFFDILADKKIRDLDLSAFDHTWNVATAAASQGNTSGYIYPVVDYGGLSVTERKADARQLRPGTFRKTIIEAIVAEAGYTVTGIALTYDKYLRSLLPFSNDKFTHGKDYIDLLKTYTASARNTGTLELLPADNETVILLNDDAATDPSNSWNGFEYIVPVNMRANIKFKYTIDQRWIVPLGGTTADETMRLQVFRGGVWILIALNITTNTQRLVLETFDNQEINYVGDFNAGEKIRICNLQGPATNRAYATIRPGAQLTVTPQAEDVTYGSIVQLAATLPDFSQKNFFKDFLQNFGLIVIPDNYKKELRLTNMEEVYNNIPIADDITDKLFNSPDDISYALSGYGINNTGNYKEDKAVTKNLGQGLMVFDNLTLEDNVSIIDSLFAASEEVVKMGGVAVAEIKMIEDIAVSSEFKTKVEPRILLDNKLNTTFTFFGPEGSQNVSLISTPRFDGLSYQTLFDENYPEILLMLYRPFAVSKQILLKETDIAKINWTLPVYDKKTASYYYVNEYKYLQGDVSTISLVRLPGKFIVPIVPVPPTIGNIVYSNSRGSLYFTDNSLEIEVDEVPTIALNETASGNINVPEGSTIKARNFTTLDAEFPNANNMFLLIKENGEEIFFDSVTPLLAGSELEHEFIVQPGSSYVIASGVNQLA